MKDHCMHRTSVDHHHHNHHHQSQLTHQQQQHNGDSSEAQCEHTTAHSKRQQRLTWRLSGVALMMLAVMLVCGGVAMDWPMAADAASLSIPISQSQLRMLRVLDILANSDSDSDNDHSHNHRLHDDADDDYSYTADDDDDDGDDDDDVSDVSDDSDEAMAMDNDDDGGPNVMALRYHRRDAYALRESRHGKRQAQSSPLLAEQPHHGVEWANPCGGVFEDDNTTPEDRPSKRQYLSIMRDAVYAENTTVKQGEHGIDVSDIAQWDKHRNKYKFLPKMNSSKIGLKRWYRKMQVYVAAFAYLGRAQHKWEQSKQLPRSNTSSELEKLFLSARRILCELEITINGSYSRAASQEKLSAFTRAEMDDKLRAFLTKVSQDGVLVEPYPQDLKFAKHGYIEMLERMHATLEKYVKLSDDQLQFGDSNDASSSSSAAVDDNESVSLHEKVMRNNRAQQPAHHQTADHSQQAPAHGVRQRKRQHASADGSKRRSALKTHREQQKAQPRHASAA